MQLTGLFIYPVKSLRGISLPSAQVDELGLVGDRRFMVVDENGRFLSQRTLPRMALIATALSADTLTLSANGHRSMAVAVGPQTRCARPPERSQRAQQVCASTIQTRSVSIWKSEGLIADDCGDDAAEWLS